MYPLVGRVYRVVGEPEAEQHDRRVEAAAQLFDHRDGAAAAHEDRRHAPCMLNGARRRRYRRVAPWDQDRA